MTSLDRLDAARRPAPFIIFDGCPRRPTATLLPGTSSARFLLLPIVKMVSFR